jgi:hypothetical protein
LRNLHLAVHLLAKDLELAQENSCLASIGIIVFLKRFAYRCKNKQRRRDL